MIVNKAIVATCPFCKTDKALLSLSNCHTWGATAWSDAKVLVPMLPVVSYVQRCGNCGQYFMWHKAIHYRGFQESFETGALSYDEWKDAYFQFKKDDTLTMEDRRTIYLSMIQAYNDQYYRGPSPLYYVEETIPEHREYLFFIDVVKEFINFNTWYSGKDKLLKAELYREIKLFDECIKTLSSIDYLGELEDFDKLFFDCIRLKANARDFKVFRIPNEKGFT